MNWYRPNPDENLRNLERTYTHEPTEQNLHRLLVARARTMTRPESAEEALLAFRDWYIAMGGAKDIAIQATSRPAPRHSLAQLRLSTPDSKYFTGSDVSNLLKQLVNIQLGGSGQVKGMPSVTVLLGHIIDALSDYTFDVYQEGGGSAEATEDTQSRVVLSLRQIGVLEEAFDRDSPKKTQMVSKEIDKIEAAIAAIRSSCETIEDLRKSGGASAINDVIMKRIFGDYLASSPGEAMQRLWPADRIR